jgi:excisionase family DNA binding protein
MIDPHPLTHTLAEVARLTGLTENAVRSRVFRGQLPAQRWGRRLLVRHDDLMRALSGTPAGARSHT